MSHNLNRRDFVVGASAVTTVGLLSSSAFATPTGNTPLTATQTFLKTLTPDDLSKTKFAFGGSTHKFWNFMGTRLKPGLVIEGMSAAQKTAAYEMLQTLLSASGYEKMRLVMETQDIMREMGRGPSSRGSERFSIALFGEPAEDKVWGLRIEGHHLSLNWTFKGAELVALTPSSFSIIPQKIPVRARKGTIVLEAEEFLGRRLIDDLTGTKKNSALIAESTPGNVLALSGRENRFTVKQGLAAADLTTAQNDLLWELIETTAVIPWPKHMQEAQRKRIRQGDEAAVHFAWAGGLQRGEMFYYRIHGDTFSLELASVFGDPEHLHATFHDAERTFGQHVV